MEKFLTAHLGESAGFRFITHLDNETLRYWKNRNRRSFFHQDLISMQEQAAWYADYEVNTENVMLIWCPGAVTSGCVGVKRHDNRIEIYNVMSWNPTLKGTGVFSRAVSSLLHSIMLTQQESVIFANVLSDNPAVTWYEKIGFTSVAHKEHQVGSKYEVLEWRTRAIFFE